MHHILSPEPLSEPSAALPVEIGWSEVTDEEVPGRRISLPVRSVPVAQS